MAKHEKKNYYAVVKGHIAPAICASWGVTNVLVSGYKNNKYKGFFTYNEAASFLEEQGYPNPKIFQGSVEGVRAPRKGDHLWYAVANGKKIGVFEYYQGGAEAGITNYSHSCHKAFKSRGEAEDFIEEYKITAGLLRAESMEEDASSNLSEQLDQLRLSKDSEAAD